MKKTTLLLLVLLIISTFTFSQTVVIDRPADFGIGHGEAIISVNGSSNVFVADFFTLTSDTILGELDLFGENNSANTINIQGFSVYIYANVNDLPAGNPINGGGIVELPNIPITAINVIQNGSSGSDFSIDLVTANDGNEIMLPAGDYWLVAAIITDVSHELGRWNWGISSFVAPIEPVLMDQVGQFITGATNWTNINSTGFGTASVTAMAWKLKSPATASVTDGNIKGFKFYPNPSSNIINLKAINNINTVDIYSVTGQKNISKKFSTNQGSLDISSLNSGFYIMKVATSSEIASYQIIKK